MKLQFKTDHVNYTVVALLIFLFFREIFFDHNISGKLPSYFRYYWDRRETDVKGDVTKLEGKFFFHNNSISASFITIPNCKTVTL